MLEPNLWSAGFRFTMESLNYPFSSFYRDAALFPQRHIRTADLPIMVVTYGMHVKLEHCETRKR